MATEALRRGDLVQTRRPSAGLWRDAFGRLRKNKLAMLGLFMVIALFIILLSVAFRETAFGKAMDGLLLVFVAIGLTSWVTVARLVRGQLLSLKETEFVEAAQAIGVSDRKIVTKHLLPNSVSPVIVAITLGIPAAILAEATLAYIGIGVQPPRASWGSLVADGQEAIRQSPHLVFFPAVAIAIALVSFTFLGDGLRDALDPKLKGKQ